MPDNKIIVLDQSRSNPYKTKLVLLAPSELKPYESRFDKITIPQESSHYHLHKKKDSYKHTPAAPLYVATSTSSPPRSQYKLEFTGRSRMKDRIKGRVFEELWIGELPVELGGLECAEYEDDEEWQAEVARDGSRATEKLQ